MCIRIKSMYLFLRAEASLTKYETSGSLQRKKTRYNGLMAKSERVFSMVHILVIAPQDSVGKRLTQLLNSAGAECVLASEPEPIFQLLKTTPINGVVINVPTLMRMQGRGKLEMQNLLEGFPTLRCRVTKGSGTVTIFDAANAQVEDHILRFVREKCSAFTARIIRRETRAEVHCALLLSADPSFPARATERTITMNISTNGCFCFSTFAWKPEDTAWLQFLDLENTTPIQATVRHSVLWRKGCRMPGCGVEFVSLSAEQKKQLLDIMQTCPLPE